MPDINSLGRDSSASDTNEPAATGSTSALNTRNEASSRNVDDPTYMTPSRPAPRPPQPSRPSQTSTGQSANGVHRWQDALGPHGSDSGSSANR
uniref:Uncharacterized protein n=1 Tax=Kwoniella dejecticola CBS 10117 TaxID=1296121 RepID=A0A1A6AH75_9TREE|nr:uncharacterized protein I303_01238 [Kwoniella dejecticola CBS 10117]OBR89411.1 hypothetical protein I303_01238 [Kwoniella dejecticola CBS 10117]